MLQRAAGWRVDSEAARAQRAERLAEALAARGWEATGAGGAEEFVKGRWAMDHVWWVEHLGVACLLQFLLAGH